MSGGRAKRLKFDATLAPCGHKGPLLMADERREVQRLRRMRFNAVAIARALGRSVQSVTDYLNSPEAQL